MRVLDVDDGKSGQSGGQQARPLAVHPASYDEHQGYRCRVGQGGQGPAGEPQVHGPPVGEQFGHRPDQDQSVDQDAPQREPVRVQRTAFRRQDRSN